MSEYLGYRVKIKSNSIPNHYISRGTWNAKTFQRLVNSWTDANGTVHENYFPTMKTEISFEIREHNLEEHREIVQYFADKKDVYITFWNDDSCEYDSFVGKIEDINWQHSNALSDDILYKSASILITEY
ncbi:MAG: hypothetical protein KBT03_13375 [Bacteroidales bacterium]|nr:hypothetical protein [Candidatus Scybalousia scybalohippi]